MRGRPKGQGLVDRRRKDVGNIIRRARIDAGLGLSDISTSLNLRVQFISNIEHGRAPLPMGIVKTLSSLLNIPLKTLAKAALQSTSVFKEYKLLVQGK